MGQQSATPKALTAAIRRLEALPQKPTLIGGCARSGTTLIASVLSAHPRIHVVAPAEASIETDSLASRPIDPARVDSLHGLLTGLPSSYTRWCEKTPRNVRNLEAILREFGDDLRFVNMVRDGRDVVTSVHPKAPGRYWVEPYRWVNDVRAALYFESDPRVTTVRYEDLVQDFERVVRDLCIFLGEPFHDSLLDYPASAAVLESDAWSEAARRPTARSVGRWRQDEHRRIVAELLATPGATQLLAHFDYLPSPSSTAATEPRWDPPTIRSLGRRGDEAPPIRIWFPSGGGLDVDLALATIGDLKGQVEAATGIPAERQIVVSQERIAANDEPLRDAGSPYHLAVRVGAHGIVCGPAARAPFPDAEVWAVEDTSLDSPPFGLDQGDVRFNSIERVREGIGRLPERTPRTKPFFQAHRKHAKPRQQALERLAAQMPPGPIIVTTLNDGFADLFRNWVLSCDRHEIDVRPRTLVFSMDEATHARVMRHGFLSFYDGVSYGDVPTHSVEAFGDLPYRKLMFGKSAIVLDALRLGRDLLFQDIDLVWLKDPLHDLQARAERGRLDYQFMYDGPNSRDQPTHYNSGFFYIRNGELARRAWSVVVDHFDEVFDYGSQQVVVNVTMQFYRERGLRVARLPEAIYMNGHVLSQPEVRANGLDLTAARVFHASWTVNLEEKRAKLRANGLWLLDDAGANPAARG